jgi:predicted transcriptional regulator
MIFPEVAKLMAYKKMRHKDLADVIGISQQAVTQKLNGETEFKRSEMIKTQKHFSDIAPNVTMDELFKIFRPSDSYMNQKRNA